MDGTPTESVESASGYRVVVHSRQLVAGLALTAFVLLLVHSVLTVYHYQVAELEWLPWRQLFDVDEENNIPTWFSGGLLAIPALWLFVVSDAKRSAADRWWMHWRLLGLGFVLLSLDEVAGLHETVNTVTDISWAIPGGILALFVGLMFFPFLWSLPARTRYAFIIAGAIYVGGAVGVEIASEPMDVDTMAYNLATVVEEGMEMAGVLAFLSALLRYITPTPKVSDGIELTIDVRE